MKLFLVLLAVLVSCKELQPEVNAQQEDPNYTPVMPKVNISEALPEVSAPVEHQEEPNYTPVMPKVNTSEALPEVSAPVADDLIQDEAEVLDEDQFKKVLHDEDALLAMMTKAHPGQVRAGIALVNNMIKRTNREIVTLRRIKKLFQGLGKGGGNSILYKAAQRGFKKNNLIATGLTIQKEWRLSLQVYQKGKVSNWGSIIHFTQGADGSRIPAIWFYPNSNRLYMCMWTARTRDDCWNGYVPAYNKWHTIVMEQRKLANGKYQIRYIIDGKVRGTKAQGKPQVLKNVKVYSSDPWYAAPNAVIKNIDFENL